MRWISSAVVRDGGLTSEALSSRLETDYLSEMMRTGRLHWFRHVESKDKNDKLNCVRYFEVESIVLVDRQKKIILDL